MMQCKAHSSKILSLKSVDCWSHSFVCNRNHHIIPSKDKGGGVPGSLLAQSTFVGHLQQRLVYSAFHSLQHLPAALKIHTAWQVQSSSNLCMYFNIVSF